MSRPVPSATPGRASAPSPPTGGEKSGPASVAAGTGGITNANAAAGGGGVWAQTSAKKEKLAELLTELNSTGVDTGEREGERGMGEPLSFSCPAQYVIIAC